MIEKLNNGFNGFLKIVDFIACIFMFSIFLCTTIQILSRELSWGIVWTEEAAKYSFVALTFIGGISVTRRMDHIAATMFVDKMPFTLRRVVEIVGQLVIAAVCVCLFWSSIKLMGTTSSIYATAMTWMRMSHFYGMIGGACLFTALAALVRITTLVADKGLLQREAEERDKAFEASTAQMLSEYDTIIGDSDEKRPGKEGVS